MFPLQTYNHTLPINTPASFGYKRKYDHHTGVDLYCDPHTKVLAMESGVVVAIENFTGPLANSPWWNDTQAVLIESASGVILYGELATTLLVGQIVSEGFVVGTILTVLKKDKGRNPTSMLHIELYTYGTLESVIWAHDEAKPLNLLDITPLLQ